MFDILQNKLKTRTKEVKVIKFEMVNVSRLIYLVTHFTGKDSK